ncbi:MAG TPA: hypothetical protein VF338_06395 [Leptolinea sp.]
MSKRIVFSGLIMVLLLTSCVLPGGKAAKVEDPTAEPAAAQPAQPVQPQEPAAPTQPEPASAVAEPTAKVVEPAADAAKPTAEETPKKAGIDFRDEFDLPNDNFTDDLIVTTQATTRDRMFTKPSVVQDGIMEFMIKDAETYIYKFVSGSMAEDVTVEAKWISKGQSLNGIALVCRASEDMSSWYEARISAQGDWSILHYDKSIKDSDPYANPYVTLKKGVAKHKLVKPAAANISKFSCVGPTLSYEINGLKGCIDTSRDPKEGCKTTNNDIKGGGMVGLGVMSSTYLPAQIDFDYFAATTP